jgi:hypothetical protein
MVEASGPNGAEPRDVGDSEYYTSEVTMLEAKDLFNEDAILVWRWHNAPAELKALSTNGGDEDWVALVPADQKDDYISWLENSSFGVCAIDSYDFEGMKVYIGCHA